ncbi:MAG: flagellar basal body-associated FliL family protein [Pseudomonadota bacterium]
MSDETENAEAAEDAAPAKPSFMGQIIGGVIQGVILGGIAFAVAFLAPFGGGNSTQTVAASDQEEGDAYAEKKGDKAGKDKKAKSGNKGKDGSYAGEDVPVAIVNLEPLVVTLGPRARSRYLKISISLETRSGNEEDINKLAPRFRDVLNNYLRAVDESDLADPAAMTRLRAQILRRIQLVSDADLVTGILITDFVLT